MVVDVNSIVGGSVHSIGVTVVGIGTRMGDVGSMNIGSVQEGDIGATGVGTNVGEAGVGMYVMGVVDVVIDVGMGTGRMDMGVNTGSAGGLSVQGGGGTVCVWVIQARQSPRSTLRSGRTAASFNKRGTGKY